MKKVLWVCNVPIPKIANHLKLNVPNICGWLVGFANSLELADNVDLHICFPILGLENMIHGKVEGITYYGFSQPKLFGIINVENQIKTSKKMEQHINEIIKLVNPDLLHIFGTEYPHSLVATKAYNRPNNTIVNIQGLTSYYWMHFNTGIPKKITTKFAFSNIARGNLIKQAKKLQIRGESETETLKLVKHVIGRTEWDKACTVETNNSVKYHFCNESLRDSFYQGNWNYENCEKFSIFMSQSSTPIKGLQFMLRAMPEILKEFPNTHLYIAGNDLTQTNTLYDKLKISSFGLYIKSLLKENRLENNVTFTGSLSELEMRKRFLKSNVFVSPSTIENSPNSLGEAMLLGLPCISSDVGGVKNMLEHKKEGFLYQSDAPYMLSYYVKEIFKSNETAIRLGKEAKKHAQRTHDREKNASELLRIYEGIYNE